MIEKKIIRSNVYVVENSAGGIYEATENPELFRINLRQIDSWYDGDKLRQLIREVPWETDIRLFRKGYIVPGNICIGYTTEDIGEENLLLDAYGDPIQTHTGDSLYMFMWYNKDTAWVQEGPVQYDDDLQSTIEGNTAKQWFEW